MPREVYALAGVAFCVALGFGIVAPIIPVFAKEFGVSTFLASATISVFALMRLISAPGAGWLVDRLGERTVLTSGLAIVAISSALAGLSQTYVQLLVLRGAGGIGSAMFTVSAFSLLLRVAAPEQRGRASGLYQSGFLTGALAGPVVGSIVVAQWSIRAPFFVYAITLAAASVVGLAALAHTPLAERQAANATADESTGRSALFAALRQRAYVTALAVNFSNGFVAFGFRSALIPLFVVEGLRQEASITGRGFFVAAVVQLPLLALAGSMSDRRGRKPALIVGALAMAIPMALLAIPQFETLVLFYLAMAVLGISAAFLASAPAAVVGDITEGRRSGPVIAAFSMSSDLGIIAGPLVAGALVDLTGSFAFAFATGAVISGVTLLLCATMPETLRKARQTPESPAAQQLSDQD